MNFLEYEVNYIESNLHYDKYNSESDPVFKVNFIRYLIDLKLS